MRSVESARLTGDAAFACGDRDGERRTLELRELFAEDVEEDVVEFASRMYSITSHV